MIIIAYIMLALCIILLIKNFLTLSYRDKMIDAIYAYHMHCYRDGIIPITNYYDMEEYEETLFRLWDWTNKRILPEEKFKAIEPFIK